MTMDRWLVISATFVHGRYHGGRGQGERDSWPPSPLRLFQALVAGARTGCCANSWTEAKASAFSWLEALDPPEIVAPVAVPGTDFTLFVPDNDMDKPAAAWAEGREPHDNFKPERLRSGKVHRPWIVGDDASVHYLWGISAAAWPEMQAPAEIIAAEARRLIALGRTIDVVVGDGRILTREATAALPGVRHVPCPASRTSLVLPAATQGTLADLDSGHQRLAGRQQGRGAAGLDVGWQLRASRAVPYRLAGAPPARHYAAFRVATLDGERWKPFPVRKAFKLAAWLRAAAAQRLAATGFDHVSIERRVFGHGATDTDAPHRLAFLPLPSIGHGHVDGQVRRILIAEPFGGDGRFERELAFGLNGEVLRPDDPARAVLLAAPEPEDERMVRRYVAPSRCWQTVTPVILPGHDDCGRKTSKVLKKALVEAGLAGFPLEGIRHQREPFIPGTEHASLYELPDYLRRYPCVHVELKFREPVPGPLCIGGGRFLGLGLLCNRS